MIKVKFFSSFCDSQNCINVYKRITELIDDHYYGKKIVFTIENDYTHAIIVNTAMPKLNGTAISRAIKEVTTVP